MKPRQANRPNLRAAALVADEGTAGEGPLPAREPMPPRKVAGENDFPEAIDPRPSSVPSGRKYLYAVVPESQELRYNAVGIVDSDVYTITHGRLSMVVSDFRQPRLRPERRNLLAHQGVLKRLMAETTLLPVSFGMIADSPAAVSKVLKANEQTLMAQLARISGKVEMGLRVTWDVANIFEYFVQKHDDLRRMRDEFFAADREPAQEERLEIGRLFERLLQEDRRTCFKKIERVLGSCCEIRENKCRNENEVISLACLAESNDLRGFESSVLQAARLFDDSFSFDYNGPWPPYSFVELNLKF
ncbi:MAG: GvpL/GvpF family gas vesicle protein [Acidobacteriia bacterium]|nr:GvpL/GvpF family gas vesicle protein [Terriglobia bacterium]